MTSDQILILYGSQTGNAESIAKRYQLESTKMGYTSVVGPLKDHEKLKFLESKITVIICSTTGNGDPPENAEAFWRFIRKNHPKDFLKGKKFAVLGLGDTNYENFCNMAKQIDKRLTQLGAEPFVNKGMADDAVGLEQVVEPWISSTWEKLSKLIEKKIEVKEEKISDSFTVEWYKDQMIQEKSQEISSINPYFAKLVGVEYLTSEEAQKQVIHMELDIGEQIQYQPGDAIGIYAQNDEKIVNMLLDVFNLKNEKENKIFFKAENAPTFIKNPSPLSLALSYLDVHSIITKFQHESLKINKDYNELLKDKVRVIDLIPNMKLSFSIDQIFSIFQFIAPRYYSASSSPLVHPQEIHFAYSIKPDGLCTNWLMKQAKRFFNDENVLIPIFLKKNGEFRLPENNSIPILMIGPGTGISPFIGFIQHRYKMKEVYQNNSIKSSEMVLFHGCRKKDIDFIYKKEVEYYLKKKEIKFYLATSQQPNEGCWYGGLYVQDLLFEDEKEVFHILEKGITYICGDAEGMGKDVIKTLKQIISNNVKSTEEVENFYQNLVKENRLQIDIW